MNTQSLQFAPKEVQARKDLDIRAGDTVRVHVKIQERGKTRIQLFEGLVLAQKHGRESGATFTVRKISNGVGVERIFPLYSPVLEKIEVIKRSRVRRSKLYYLRNKVARDIRRKMRNFVQFTATTDDLEIPADQMVDEEIEEGAEEAPVTESVENTQDKKTTEETPKDESSEEAPKEEAENIPEPQEEVVSEETPKEEPKESADAESTPEDKPKDSE